MPINPIIQAYLAAREQGRRAGQSILQKQQFEQNLAQRQQEEEDRQKEAEQRAKILQQQINVAIAQSRLETQAKLGKGEIPPTSVEYVPGADQFGDPMQRRTQNVLSMPEALGGGKLVAPDPQNFAKQQAALARIRMEPEVQAKMRIAKLQIQAKNSAADIAFNQQLERDRNQNAADLARAREIVNGRIQAAKLRIDAKAASQGEVQDQIIAAAHDASVGIYTLGHSPFDRKVAAYMSANHLVPVSTKTMDAMTKEVSGFFGIINGFRSILTDYKDNFGTTTGPGTALGGAAAKLGGVLHLSEFGIKIQQLESFIAKLGSILGNEPGSRISNLDIGRYRKSNINPSDSYALNVDRYNTIVDVARSTMKTYLKGAPKAQRDAIMKSMGLDNVLVYMPGGTVDYGAKASEGSGAGSENPKGIAKVLDLEGNRVR